jgi:DNA polymerase III delta prime subunit
MGDLGFGISDSVRLQDHRDADAIPAEERAEWLIDYILLHQGDERGDLIRRAVDQFLEAEAVAYERGRRHG